MKLLPAILLLVCASAFATERSTTQTNHFRKANACPATGLIQRNCKGYVIDHVIPLACGGADRPTNMQWQTVAEGKAKDRWERKGCGVKP